MSKNNSKESKQDKIPDSFTQALVQTIWHSRWRSLYLIVGVLAIVAFSIWTTLPESSKQQLLTKIGVTEKVEGTTSEDVNRKLVKKVESKYTLPINPAILSIVEARGAFHGSIVVPLAQANRGKIYSIFVWPILVSGDRIADDDIFGITLEKTEGGEFKIVRDWGGGREELENEVGGSDFTIWDRGAGVPLLELGPIFKSSWDSFHGALRSDARKKASEAAVKMSQLFSLELAAFDDTVSEILIMAYELGPGVLEYRGTRSRGMVADVEFQFTNTKGTQKLVFEAGIHDVRNDLWVFERIR